MKTLFTIRQHERELKTDTSTIGYSGTGEAVAHLEMKDDFFNGYNIGVVCAIDQKLTIELKYNSDTNDISLPYKMFETQGHRYLSIYGIKDEETITTDLLELYVDKSNTLNTENAPKTPEWQVLATQLITQHIKLNIDPKLKDLIDEADKLEKQTTKNIENVNQAISYAGECEWEGNKIRFRKGDGTWSEWKVFTGDFLTSLDKGAPDGVASLDVNGKQIGEQIPQEYVKQFVYPEGKSSQVLMKVGNEPGEVKFEDVSAIVAGDTLPIGSTLEWYSDTIPENWLLADGREVSRTTYAELFGVLGTKYGEGDGTTTFNLPNKKGRASVGIDTSDSDFNLLGKIGGEKEHQLTVEELASHYHKYNDSSQSTEKSTSGSVSWVGSVKSNTDVTGGDKPHNNLQPYIVTNSIIKARQSAGVVANVINSLESTSKIDALSANQGKILNESKKNNIQYSSNRKFIGEYDTDGKKVYCAVIEYSFATSGKITIEHNLDIFSILNVKGYCTVYGTGTRRPIPFINETSSTLAVQSVTKNDLIVFSSFTENKIKLYLEFTCNDE